MTSTLSFGKESIQRSSSASETLNQATEAHGLRADRDKWPTVVTTTLTVTQ